MWERLTKGALAAVMLMPCSFCPVYASDMDAGGDIDTTGQMPDDGMSGMDDTALLEQQMDMQQGMGEMPGTEIIDMMDPAADLAQVFSMEAGTEDMLSQFDAMKARFDETAGNFDPDPSPGDQQLQQAMEDVIQSDSFASLDDQLEQFSQDPGSILGAGDVSQDLAEQYEQAQEPDAQDISRQDIIDSGLTYPEQVQDYQQTEIAEDPHLNYYTSPQEQSALPEGQQESSDLIDSGIAGALDPHPQTAAAE